MTKETRMTKSENRALPTFSVIGLLLLATGCTTVEDYSLTYKLWTNPQLRRFAEPAPEPHLALAASIQNKDLLVQYDETLEQNDKVRRRAYFLRQNAERIGRREKPRFLNPQIASAMTPVLINDTPAKTTTSESGPSSLVAVFPRGAHEFVLLQDGATEGSYALPVYLESNATFLRVLLTPAVVAGDTVMVGLVASVVAAYALAAGAVR
jgi:hypothetical protein